MVSFTLSKLWTSALLLLLTTASPAPAAAEAEGSSRLLTSENFDSNVGTGTWLVEFYSPYCGHCKKFAPTWQKVVEARKSLDTSGKFHMAQVNCIASGDLCGKQNIRFYPDIKLYHNGRELEDVQIDRTVEALTSYIDTQVARLYPAEEIKKDAPPAPESPASEDTQDLLKPHYDPRANPDGKVLVLTDEIFESVTADGPLFVKFYAPWCGHCKKLAPVWTELAAKMKNIVNIAEVNCDEHSSLCRSQGVEGYPMLFFYNKGRKTDYRGGRKLPALEDFATKAVRPGVQEVKLASFEKLMASEKVLYVFLHGFGVSGIDLAKVEKSAESLMGSPMVVRSSDPAVWKKLKRNASTDPSMILAVKDGKVSRSFSLVQTTPQVTIQTWLELNRLPVSDELSSENFQSIMKSPTKPLVVLVALNPSERGESGLRADIQKLNDMAREWDMAAKTVRGRPVMFVWMDASRWEKWLKSMYGVKPNDLPRVIITDHDSLVYYDTDSTGTVIGFNRKSITQALHDIDKGTSTSKHSENVIERTMRGAQRKLEAFEEFFFEHPFRALGMIAVVVSVLIILIFKAIRMDTDPYHRDRKASRLD